MSNELRHTTGDPAFDAWMRELDAAVTGIAGIGIFDLPDQDFHSYYPDVDPEEAAREILEAEGFPGDDDY